MQRKSVVDISDSSDIYLCSCFSFSVIHSHTQNSKVIKWFALWFKTCLHACLSSKVITVIRVSRVIVCIEIHFQGLSPEMLAICIVTNAYMHSFFFLRLVAYHEYCYCFHLIKVEIRPYQNIKIFLIFTPDTLWAF